MNKIYLTFMAFLAFGCKTSMKEYKPAKSTSEIQQEYCRSGEKYLKSNKLEQAFISFHIVNMSDQTSDLVKIAKNKIDSILPLIQKKKLEEWKGIWEIKELHFNPYPGTYPDFIEINNDKVIFYKRTENSQKVIIRDELIRFVKYQTLSLYSENYNLMFNNSEIWSFELTKKNGLKKLYPKIESDTLGGTVILLDERFMIRNKQKRKQALKKELYTFYTETK